MPTSSSPILGRPHDRADRLRNAAISGQNPMASDVSPSRPRVLYIGSGSPWEGGAGYLLRQHMFLQALDAMSDLHLALFDAVWEVPPTYGRAVTGLPLSNCSESRLRHLWNDLTNPLPLTFRTHAFDETRRIIKSLNPDSFDAIFAYRVDFAHFAGVLGHPRLILDIDDPEHVRRRLRFQTHELSWFDWRSRLDLRRMRRFELNAARNAVRAFVCQVNDQQVFDHPQPYVVPNCVNVPPVRPAHDPNSRNLLFVGSLFNSNQSPNIDAVRWFVEKVWPGIVAAEPSARFHIVGEVKKSFQEFLKSIPNVVIRGYVEDLADAYRHAAFSIAPIRYGTGTRLKIIESMAQGCPVVSTTKGWEGLELTPDEHLLVADSPNAWIETCLNLLQNSDRQESLSKAAFTRTRELYDVDARRPWLTKVLADAIAAARAAPVKNQPAAAL
ncbi:MAG TPA: glycosyltransferase [Phycisphaerales bacterium]|nr:glycosyltransferase [Phycisphaerales bacterium]